VLPVDVADASAVDGVLGTIRAELPPLRGVFHAAMVLQDCLLVDLDREMLQGVLRSKVFGGWNLHQATKDLDLDHFVLFSSLSSVFGHAGQANYSAANAFLDGLAHHRRWMGLPACVINWGHLGDVGYLARHEQLSERLRRQGVLSFSLKQAFESLQHILQHQLIQASVLRIDWSVWRGLGVSGEVSPRFAHLIHDSSVVEHAIASADQIRQATGEKRRELVDQMMRHKVSALLGLRNDQLDARRCLIELGLDSLMAVELRNWIESQIRIGLPIAQLMRDTTLADLVDLICDGVVEDQAEPSGSDAASTAEVVADGSGSQPSGDAKELLEALPGMSPDEVTNLLSQLLREQESASDERS
jgi:aryl carrier-like protein